ncbi:hypothetical protein BLI708_01245 [Bifidobacterium imperatoris]|uniref:Ig-like domain-containing protein n=1 Tax=Bifidobacterium imperatoris TaxID=2020965 RepID=A0A2N5IS54_9BIFI|nr:hypothetical protein [Bifidobacterium imperatoris]PLS24795.1 hypothetical protein Tam1G_1123 [Bifidobacterium imperatoris]QSY57985.1 hypothetical protein BLI708_01245 [Bifidobacterium imperatoris]
MVEKTTDVKAKNLWWRIIVNGAVSIFVFLGFYAGVFIVHKGYNLIPYSIKLLFDNWWSIFNKIKTFTIYSSVTFISFIVISIVQIIVTIFLLHEARGKFDKKERGVLKGTAFISVVTSSYVNAMLVLFLSGNNVTPYWWEFFVMLIAGIGLILFTVLFVPSTPVSSIRVCEAMILLSVTGILFYVVPFPSHMPWSLIYSFAIVAGLWITVVLFLDCIPETHMGMQFLDRITTLHVRHMLFRCHMRNVDSLDVNNPVEWDSQATKIVVNHYDDCKTKVISLNVIACIIIPITVLDWVNEKIPENLLKAITADSGTTFLLLMITSLIVCVVQMIRSYYWRRIQTLTIAMAEVQTLRYDPNGNVAENNLDAQQKTDESKEAKKVRKPKKQKNTKDSRKSQYQQLQDSLTCREMRGTVIKVKSPKEALNLKDDINLTWNTQSDGKGMTWKPGTLHVVNEDIVLYACDSQENQSVGDANIAATVTPNRQTEMQS